MSHPLGEAEKAWLDQRADAAYPNGPPSMRAVFWAALAEAIDFGKSRAIDAFATVIERQNLQLVPREHVEDGDGDAD